MSEPTEFLIVQNLQAALQAISVAGGYHHDLAALAVKLDPNQDVEALLGEEKKRPFIVLELTPDEWTYAPSKMVGVQMPATIHFVNDSDPTDDDSWLREYLCLCADAEQALAVDISRGGRAVDTRIDSREFQSFGGAQVWAMVKTRILVRRQYGSPNG
jgi:hypothetical protein